MSGFEVRVNGEIECRTPFAEENGERGVLFIVVEWMLLRQHEICWLVLEHPLRELFPGDEVSLRIVEGPVAATPPRSTDVSYRVLPSKPREIAIEVQQNGVVLRQVHGAKAVDATVTWIRPTHEMEERGVHPQLYIASATGPHDIQYVRAAPGDEVVFRLSELPVAAAESAFATEASARGAA